MKKIIPLIVTVFVFFSISQGQEVELEKTYDIPGKADIGDNPHVGYNDASGNFDYTFILKAKSDRINIENYQFDKDFNLVNSIQEELDISAAKAKYPWWNYEGDKLTKTSISVDEDDNLVLRTMNFEYTYNWKKLQYTIKPSLQDKLKLKNVDGSSYFHYRNWTSEDDPDNLYILCGIKSKSDQLEYCKNFHLLLLNKTLEVVKDIEIRFTYPQDVVYPRFMDDKSEQRVNEFDNSIILVFAPKNEGSKASDPQKTNYTYVSVNDKLEIVDRLSFLSPSSFWSIEDNIQSEQSNAVFLFGASLNVKDKYFDQLKDTKTFDGVEVMKVEDHKVTWVNEYSIDEMENKVVMAPSQKKGDPYDGKRIFISNYMLTDNGKLLFVGQQFFYDAMTAINEGRKKVKYADCFGIAIDNDGQLIGQYLYDMKGFMGGQDFSIFQFLFPGKNPDNAYWMLIQPVYWDWSSFLGGGYYTKRPVKPGALGMGSIGSGFSKINCDLISSNFGKIDLNANSLTDFTNYQVNKEKKKSYILSTNPPFMYTDDNKLILFGTQSISGGKRLWFLRLRLD